MPYQPRGPEGPPGRRGPFQRGGSFGRPRRGGPGGRPPGRGGLWFPRTPFFDVNKGRILDLHRDAKAMLRVCQANLANNEELDFGVYQRGKSIVLRLLNGRTVTGPLLEIRDFLVVLGPEANPRIYYKHSLEGYHLE